MMSKLVGELFCDTMSNKLVVSLLMCQILCTLQNQMIGHAEDGRLGIRQLSLKYGYPAVEYRVTTEDGYELGLFRIKGANKTGVPVLLAHGIMDSADTWLVRGNSSLAIALAKRGRDVWMPTFRGGRHSRSHVNLKTDDALYWDFSFHEIGIYDLAAVIDTMLEKTGVRKLDAIAHSQGNTIFYVLLSTKPEYNDKVNLLIGLAPAAYFYDVPPPLKTLIKYAPMINEVLIRLGVHEMFGDTSWLNIAIRAVCSKPKGYRVCVTKYLFPISGEDDEELEPEFLQVLVGHFPTSVSRKNLHHFSQIGLRGEFSQYDYGTEGNLEKYNVATPPAYNLSLVTPKVALLAGANDKITTVENIAILEERLPNVVHHLVLPRAVTNHVDFVWGRNMDKYLFPYIFELLDSHRYDSEKI